MIGIEVHEDPKNQPRKLASLFGLALAVTLTLGACGSGATSDDASGESASADLPTLEAGGGADAAAIREEGEDSEISEEDAEAAIAQYDKCMADFGIELDLGSAGGGGADVESTQFVEGADDGGALFDEDSFDEASETCDPILEDAFGDFELSPEQEAEMADQMLEMQKCLADAGFDIDMSEGAFELDPDVDFDEFENAMSQCEPAGIETAGTDQ